MNIGTAFPSNYWKAADLADGEVQLKIESVQVEEMERSGEEKPVLYFADEKKGLCLNKTNAAILQEAYDAETEGWFGKPVVLFKTKTEFAGKRVDCIRVRIPKARATKPAADPNAELQEAADPDQAPWE